MKYILIIALFMIAISNALSQDFLTTIAQKSCDCAKTIPDTLEVQQANMKLGICMLEASVPYKKQIKKTYDIDLDNIADEGERFGRIVGVKLATICPDAILRISQKTNAAKTKSNLVSVGTVTKIENDLFVIFSLKDEAGKVTKYYWFTFIDSQIDLTNSYSSLTGKAVRISYQSQEFFDPRLLEYRQFYVIKKIESAD